MDTGTKQKLLRCPQWQVEAVADSWFHGEEEEVPVIRVPWEWERLLHIQRPEGHLAEANKELGCSTPFLEQELQKRLLRSFIVLKYIYFYAQIQIFFL